MQLRVARLCLDCEELHSDNTCPRCASARYAFLTTWLPTEERRRWRRPPPSPKRRASAFGAALHIVARWFGVELGPHELPRPATRRSDLLADMTFETQESSRTDAVEATDRTAPTTPGR